MTQFTLATDTVIYICDTVHSGYRHCEIYVTQFTLATDIAGYM